jgi:hypothetical protein
MYKQNMTSILWHVDPLLGNDREISAYATAVSKQRLRKQANFYGNNYPATEERSFLRGP